MAYKRKRYRYKLRYKLIFWSLIAMLLFSIATIFMNQPSTGTIVKPTLSDAPLGPDPTKTNTITTKYFSLVYNAGLDTVSNISSDDKTALEVYRVARSDTTGRRTFVVTIKNLPGGGMSEESSYKYRYINPKEFRQSSETIGKEAFVLFEKVDGSEITAFATRGGQLAMLSYTLATPGVDVMDEARELFGNFQWVN